MISLRAGSPPPVRASETVATSAQPASLATLASTASGKKATACSANGGPRLLGDGELPVWIRFIYFSSCIIHELTNDALQNVFFFFRLLRWMKNVSC